MGLNNHVFDHKTQKRGIFPCYRLKINDFLSSYNQNLKIDIFTPLQQIPCYCKSRLGTLRLISWWRVTFMERYGNWTIDKKGLIKPTCRTINNNNLIQRRYSRFFTISSQRRELSPTRTLKWPGRNRVQITCNTSSADHVQVSCYVPLGTKGQLSS